jgi:hypothetical protein
MLFTAAFVLWYPMHHAHVLEPRPEEIARRMRPDRHDHARLHNRKLGQQLGLVAGDVLGRGWELLVARVERGPILDEVRDGQRARIDPGRAAVALQLLTRPADEWGAQRVLAPPGASPMKMTGAGAMLRPGT